jgi:hypothetical protein
MIAGCGIRKTQYTQNWYITKDYQNLIQSTTSTPEIHQQGERCVQAWNILSTIPETWLFTK